MPEHAIVTVKKVATKEDWLKFRSICTLAGLDATKVIQRFVGHVVEHGSLEYPVVIKGRKL